MQRGASWGVVSFTVRSCTTSGAGIGSGRVLETKNAARRSDGRKQNKTPGKIRGRVFSRTRFPDRK